MHEKIIAANMPGVQALSYIGDSRHSLYVRLLLVKKGIAKSGDLNKAALEYVTAEAQAETFKRIEPYLTEEERDAYRRAANSGHLNKPKHASAKDYRTASGFEAVLGMLTWLGDEERITELLNIAYENGG